MQVETSETPTSTEARAEVSGGSIHGALGYLILPIDVVPDFVPVVGYVDDLGALMLAIGATAMAIDGNVKNKAKDKLHDFFGAGAADNPDIIDIDAHIVEDDDVERTTAK